MTFCSDVTKIKSARKPHRCTWCAQMIEVGQPYERWATIEDGVYVNQMHPECNAALTEMSRLDHCGFVEYEPHSMRRGSTKER